MKSFIFNIHDVVLFITIVLCLLLAVFQFFYPAKNNLSKYLLTLFFIDVSVDMAAVLLFWNPIVSISPVLDSYFIPYILFGSLLLKGPLLYGYVSSVTTNDFRLKPFDLIHLTPLLFCFMVFFISGRNAEDIRTHLQSGNVFMRLFSTYEWHLVKIIPLIYAALAVYKVNFYIKSFDRRDSSGPTQPTWLMMLTWGTLLNWSWSLLVHLFGFYYGGVLDKLGIADNYLTLILTITLFVSSLFYANKLLGTNVIAEGLQFEKNTESSIVEKITQCMEVEKLFLNPRLNIERMSEHINFPYREVSAILNYHFHANFFEYINQHRINEAKRLLSDPALIDLPINEIFSQAGFNSKSAFHRFFNRLVGMSPSEFRKKAMAASGSGSHKNAAI